MTRTVFVLGTGRCGSTLVHEVLARHDDTGFLTNLDDLRLARSTRWHNRAWRRLPPAVTQKGRVRFAPTEGYRVLERAVGTMLAEPSRDLTAQDATPWLRDRLVGFVTERVDRLDAPVFLHKLTGWPRAGLLDACFPDALFVEVVRDGRAVANSWLQMPWWRGYQGPDRWQYGPLPPDLAAVWDEHDRSFPVLAALLWRMLMDAYDEARARLPADRWLRLRYEDVVADPRRSFGTVLDAAGLPWDDAFERGFGGYRFSTGRTDAFRHDLATADVAAMETVLGRHLARLDYH